VPVVGPTPTVVEITPSGTTIVFASVAFTAATAATVGALVNACAGRIIISPATLLAIEALAILRFTALPTVGVNVNCTVEAVASLSVTQIPIICLSSTGPLLMVNSAPPFVIMEASLAATRNPSIELISLICLDIVIS